MHKVHDLIHEIMRQLEKKHTDHTEQQQDAWWILTAITGQSHAQLLAQDTITLTLEQKKQLKEWLHLHIDKHMPLQYLIGSVPFADCVIAVKPPTLIPRPETEEWVLNLIEQLKQKPPTAILDIGTGSGCIAIALARAFAHAQVYAVDMSHQAIALAQENAARNNVHITVIESDLFASLPTDLRFDVIVSNPPYIALTAWPTVSRSVRDWEDKHALLAGKDGLDVIKRIIHDAQKWLHPGGQLIIEIGYDQGAKTKALMERAGWSTVTVHKDLEGKDRVISARL